MTPSEQLYSVLRASGLDCFLSVPCKLLARLIEIIKADSSVLYTPVTREEEGVGIAFGANLGGRNPAIVMQNSGFGNCTNAILSLLNYYRTSVVFVVSHRGSAGEPIEAQGMMGNAIVDLLKAIGVESVSVPDPIGLSRLPAIIERARREGRSLAILLPFSFWAGES